MGKIRLIYIILFNLGIYGYANTPQGTIEEAEFIIKKEKKNELPESSRLFKKAPLPSPTTKPNVKLQYELYDPHPTFQALDHKIKILRAKQDIIARLYGNYLKLGYGNYYAPHISFFANNTRKDKYGYGAHLFHASEGKNKYFEAYKNELGFYGKVFTENLKYSGELYYTGNKYPSIHFTKDINNTENDPNKHHTYHQTGLRGSLQNYLPTSLNYHVDIHAIHLRNQSSKQENQLLGILEANYIINEIFKANIKWGLDFIDSKGSHTSSLKHFISHFKPALITKFNNFTMQAGANLAYQNDTRALNNTFYIYPDLEIIYAFNKVLRPYIRLSGDIQPNTWQKYIVENPWLAPSVDIRHTNQNYNFHVGVYSDLFELLSSHAGISISNYYNWPCFINHHREPREFDIKYESSATVLNLFVELTKISFAEALSTRIKAEYFHYQLDGLKQAWHRPQYMLEIFNAYKFREKILFKNNLYWLGGIQALDPHTDATVSLSDIVDISLGIEYLWNQRFSIFIDCKNILAKANNRYLHTPTHGMHLIAGITYGW